VILASPGLLEGLSVSIGVTSSPVAGSPRAPCSGPARTPRCHRGARAESEDRKAFSVSVNAHSSSPGRWLRHGAEYVENAQTTASGYSLCASSSESKSSNQERRLWPDRTLSLSYTPCSYTVHRWRTSHPGPVRSSGQPPASDQPQTTSTVTVGTWVTPPSINRTSTHPAPTATTIPVIPERVVTKSPRVGGR